MNKIDEMIAKALEEEFEERVEQAAGAKKHRFSLSYRLWEHKTLRDLRRGKVNKHWTLKRAKAIVAAGLTAVCVLGGTTAVAFINAGRYSFKDRQDYLEMFIENHPSDKTMIEEYYGLPEEHGWIITDVFIAKTYTAINYKCGNKTIKFTQKIIHEGSMEYVVSFPDSDIEILSVFEENDALYVSFDENWGLFFWVYDGYLLEIRGSLNKNSAINLAHSTKIIEKPKIS